MKKQLSICLTFVLLTVLLVPSLSHGATLSDIRGHWAETYINQAVQKGFVQGYPDGTFLPDKAVSRAEFTSMVNKALGNNGTSSITFTDVPSNEWFYSDISKAVAATYVAGYDNNTFLPNSPITRQEAAVVISRIVPTYGSSGNLNAFPDYKSVADWALSAFQKVNGKGYIGAYDDGNLHPLDQLTRAQTAKIICDILDKETIVKTDPSVTARNTTLSNTVYSNGVTIHKDLADGSATIENCVILGNLSVQGGGENTVTVSNSRVARGAVEKSASAVRLLVKGETVVSSLTAARAATIQTSNLTGGLYGSGIGNLSTLSSSDIKLQGSFPKVTISGSGSKLNLVSGSVSNLIVSSSGRQSEITVESGASAGTVDVNAECYFHGTGTISRMNVYADGVTYEKKPSVLNVGSQYKTPEEGSSDPVKFNPSSGSTKVKLDTKITITFDTAMRLYDGGSAITSSNIDEYISLREGSSSGSHVDFSASINSAKTVITITPDDDLDDDTRYYVILPKNSFKNGDGEGNKAYSIYFSTGSDTDSFTTYSPKSGATEVDEDVSPKITFSEAVQTYNSKAVTNSYLDNSVIIFRENNSSGTRVPFEATINSAKKVITITPDDELEDGQKYYLAIASSKFRTQSGGTAVASSSVTWTVGESSSDVTFYPSNGATGVSLSVSPSITFNKAVETSSGKTISDSYLDSTVINFREGSSSGSKVSFTASINSSKKEITIYPNSSLKDGQKYYLAIVSNKFRTQSGSTNIGSKSVTWTASSVTPSLTTSGSPLSESSLRITATPNLAGTLYAVLLKSGTSAPSATQIINGQNASGTSVASGFRINQSVSANSAKSFDFTGLEKSTTYVCYMVLKPSSSSYSNSSVYTRSVTTSGTVAPTVPTAPTAPLNLQAIPGDEQVALVWSAPSSNGGSAVTRYQYSASSTSAESWTDVPSSTASTTKYTVFGLTNGTSYTFKVRAVNSVGAGAASNAVTEKPTTAYKITVNAGSASPTTATAGTTITVTANAPSGQRFKAWESSASSVKFASSTSATTTFTMPAQNVEITAICELIPKVDSVSVSPSTSDVTKGDTCQFEATVKGTGDPDLSVTWSVSGGSGSTITPDGYLVVSPKETATTLTVTATSKADNSVKGTAKVTVITPEPEPTEP